MGSRKRPAEEGSEDLSSMLRSGKYHDFTIKCNERTWKVHRAIICAKSKYFETLCDSRFKEANERKINLEDEDPKYVEAMLLYMYTTIYPFALNVEGVGVDKHQVLDDAKLYALADKYRIPALKKHAQGSFSTRLYRFAKRNHTPPMEELAELLATVYETTPSTDRGLRNSLLWNILQQRKKLLGRQSVMAYARKNHDFALDLLAHYMAEGQSNAADKFSYWCAGCRRYTTRAAQGKCGAGHALLDWSESPETLL